MGPFYREPLPARVESKPVPDLGAVGGMEPATSVSVSGDGVANLLHVDVECEGETVKSTPYVSVAFGSDPAIPTPLRGGCDGFDCDVAPIYDARASPHMVVLLFKQVPCPQGFSIEVESTDAGSVATLYKGNSILSSCLQPENAPVSSSLLAFLQVMEESHFRLDSLWRVFSPLLTSVLVHNFTYEPVADMVSVVSRSNYLDFFLRDTYSDVPRLAPFVSQFWRYTRKRVFKSFVHAVCSFLSIMRYTGDFVGTVLLVSGQIFSGRPTPYVHLGRFDLSSVGSAPPLALSVVGALSRQNIGLDPVSVRPRDMSSLNHILWLCHRLRVVYEVTNHVPSDSILIEVSTNGFSSLPALTSRAVEKFANLPGVSIILGRPSWPPAFTIHQSPLHGTYYRVTSYGGTVHSCDVVRTFHAHGGLWCEKIPRLEFHFSSQTILEFFRKTCPFVLHGNIPLGYWSYFTCPAFPGSGVFPIAHFYSEAGDTGAIQPNPYRILAPRSLDVGVRRILALQRAVDP